MTFFVQIVPYVVVVVVLNANDWLNEPPKKLNNNVKENKTFLQTQTKKTDGCFLGQILIRAVLLLCFSVDN